MYQAGDRSSVNVPINDSLTRCFTDVIVQSNYEEKRKETDEFNR